MWRTVRRLYGQSNITTMTRISATPIAAKRATSIQWLGWVIQRISQRIRRYQGRQHRSRSQVALDLFPEFVASPRCPQSAVDHLGQPICQQVHRGIVEVVGWQGFLSASRGW
jgi:hypothetical protein